MALRLNVEGKRLPDLTSGLGSPWVNLYSDQRILRLSDRVPDSSDLLSGHDSAAPPGAQAGGPRQEAATQRWTTQNSFPRGSASTAVRYPPSSLCSSSVRAPRPASRETSESRSSTKRSR